VIEVNDVQQRGRQSAANLTTLPFNRALPRIDPPANLNKAEAKLFVEIVSACAPKHFIPSDAHLLATYVRWMLIGEKSFKKNALETFETASRMMNMLAQRLRLAPSSRMNQRQTSRGIPPIGPGPWETDE
jgi:hypothetical protein